MEHPDGTTVLVLGILSLVVCGFLGPFAWKKGNDVLAEMDRHPQGYSNRGSVEAGRICGIISSVLLMVGAAVFILVLVIVASAANS